MKRVLAITACAAEVLVYAVICALLGWKHAGGLIPLLVFLSIMSLTWTAITGQKSSFFRGLPPYQRSTTVNRSLPEQQLEQVPQTIPDRKSSEDEGHFSSRIHPLAWVAMGISLIAGVGFIAATQVLFGPGSSPIAEPPTSVSQPHDGTQTSRPKIKWDEEPFDARGVVADSDGAASRPSVAAIPQRHQLTSGGDPEFLQIERSAVFDTTGHKNANGLRLRMSYPREWKAEEGDGPATVQRFISDGGRGNRGVLIQTWALPKPFNRALTEAEKKTYLSKEVVQTAFGREIDIKFHTITQLNDETCEIVEIERIIPQGSVKVGMKALVFILVRNGVQLMLTCYVQGDATRDVSPIRQEYEAAKLLFMDIAQSCVFIDAPVVQPQSYNQSYAKVQLAHGISLSIPTSWFVFDKDWNALTRENALALSGDISSLAERKNFQHTVLLRITTRANLPYGSLAVNLYDKPMLSPEVAAEIVKTGDLLEQLRQSMHKEIASQAPELLVGDSTIGALQVDGHPAVRFDYQRRSTRDNSVVQCHIIRVFVADKTLSIVSSYALAAKELYAPILDACIKSISIAETGR